MAWLFIILFALMIMGIPIAAATGVSTFVWLVNSGKPMVLFASNMAAGLDSFVRLAIPLFIFCGYVMETCGLSKRLVDGVSVWVGNVRGSMGMITIVACTIFAALTGSAPATVAAIGAIMLPALLKQGYSDSQAAGILCSGGSLGPIIPPSVGMIVYGALMEVSIPKMFAAAIIPGLMLSLAMIVLNQIQTKRWGMQVAKKEKISASERAKKTIGAIPALLMPLFVLGSIYGGICTPSEAASVACVYCLVLGVILRTLTLKKLWDALVRTVKTSAAVGFILATVQLFSWILSYSQLPVKLSQAVMSVTSNPNIFIAVVVILILIEGCFMESLSIITIMAPILAPIGIAMGIDPVRMGVIICLCMIMGVMRPPFGVNLFYTVATTNISYDKVVKGTIPFMIVDVIVVIACCFMPWTMELLPKLFFGK